MIEDVFYRLPCRIASAISVRAAVFSGAPPGRKLPARLVNEASFTVGDLQRSIHFYTEVVNEASFTMRLLRQHDYPDGKFTLAFVGYGPETEQAVIELTY